MIKRPYQCSIAVNQLVKLQMLEFCYDFLDKHLNRQDLSYVLNLDEISLNSDRCMRLTRKIWYITEGVSERTPGLFKPKFVGAKGVWLTSKCYLVQNQDRIGKNKYSCKGVPKKHDDLF